MTLTDKKLFAYLLLYALLDMGLVTLWTLIDAPSPQLLPHSSQAFAYVSKCTSGVGDIFRGLIYVLRGFALLFGAFLAIRIRKVDADYDESKVIAIVTYNIIIVLAIVLAVGAIGSNAPEVTVGAWMAGVSLAVFFSLAVFVLPKVYSVLTDPTAASANDRGNGNQTQAMPEQQQQQQRAATASSNSPTTTSPAAAIGEMVAASSGSGSGHGTAATSTLPRSHPSNLSRMPSAVMSPRSHRLQTNPATARPLPIARVPTAATTAGKKSPQIGADIASPSAAGLQSERIALSSGGADSASDADPPPPPPPQDDPEEYDAADVHLQMPTRALPGR